MPLRDSPGLQEGTLNPQIKLDIKWWIQFLHKFNGQSILWLQDTLVPNIILTTDACLDAMGATCQNQYVHSRFPEEIRNEFTNIAH